MVLKQLDICRQKNEPQPKPYILYKNYLKMYHELKPVRL